MLALAVVSGPWPHLGVIVAAVLAGVAVLSRRDVRRAWAMLGATILAPVLLLADVWHSSQLSVIHRHGPEAVVGGVVVLVALVALARLIRRYPWLVAVLTMLTLPFRVPISAGGTTSNLLVPLYFVVAASVLAWAVPTLWANHHGELTEEQQAERPRRYLFEQLLCAYVVVYALQALYSSDFQQALQNRLFFYVPFAVLLALLRDIEWDRELLVRCLTLTVFLGVVFALIGYGEELTQTLWLNSNLVDANQLHQYFQVNSVFYDPDIFGRYLALVMVLLVTVLLFDKRPRIQIGSIVALAILWGCLIFTLSRSSLVALALGMAVLAMLRWRARPVLYLAAVVVVIGAVIVAVHPSTFGLTRGINSASSGRANLITGGAKLFSQRPLAGWGSGSFSTRYRAEFLKSARSVSDSHNIPITVAAEQGVIGLLFYVGLVIAAIITLLRGARGDPFRVGTAAAFLALLSHTMLYADFLEDPVTWALLGVGAALATIAGARAASDERENRRQPRMRVHV